MHSTYFLRWAVRPVTNPRCRPRPVPDPGRFGPSRRPTPAPRRYPHADRTRAAKGGRGHRGCFHKPLRGTPVESGVERPVENSFLDELDSFWIFNPLLTRSINSLSTN